jgi:TolB-like protein/Flp pilus assembly protein TadD
MGTVGYMSPEQVRGLPVDHRSDIFSFGAILYELLSGRKAFKKDTPGDTMAAIIRDEPPELLQSGRNIPVALDHLVKHCLEKDRDNRFQSAKDVAYALSEASSSSTAAVTSGSYAIPQRKRGKTLAIAAAVVAVLAAGGLFLWKRPRTGGTASAAGVKRIAVLPFENLGAPADDYFADGIADEVRGKLTSLKGVEVIARGSSTPYKKTTKTPQQIAKELDAHYLLTATVRWQKGAGGSRVQVRPELVEIGESSAPASRWQQPFDAAITDVFQVQSDIATKVALALGGALGEGEEQRLSEKPTENLAAYDAYLKGEDASAGMANSDPLSLRKALSFYDQAVALDPGFVEAWARSSRANSSLYYWGQPSGALDQNAKRTAEKAIALSPRRAEGYQALGEYYRMVVTDFSRALEQYDKGRGLGQPSSDLLVGVALAEEALGRWDASLDHLKQSVRLDPRSVVPLRRLGDALIRLRRYPEARDVYDKALALAPANLASIEGKVMSYLGEGDLSGAQRVIGEADAHVAPTALVAYLATYEDLSWVLDEKRRELLVRLTPSTFDDDRGAWALTLTQALALRGDADGAHRMALEAVTAYEAQDREAPNNTQIPTLLGLSYAYAGRKDDAIREGLKGTALAPISKDTNTGAYNLMQLARIYTLVGEPEKAIDALEQLLKMPSNCSPPWLAINPYYETLHKNPRFQALTAKK